MESYEIVIMAVLLLLIFYLLTEWIRVQQEKRLRELFLDISTIFTEVENRRQDVSCEQLIEAVGRVSGAASVTLKINMSRNLSGPDTYLWEDATGKIKGKQEAELTVELKDQDKDLGTISITGDSAYKLLKDHKNHFSALIAKLLKRFYEDEKLYFMAYYDQLTKLPNRAYLLQVAEEANEAASRNNEMVAYLFFDLDAFKVVNDTMGHESGDELLKAVAGRISQDNNKFSMAARYGGDEYLIMLKHVTKMEQVIWAAETLMGLFHEPFILFGRKVNITASVGISLYPCHGNNINELLVSADKAMYQSKARGKNQYDIISVTR